MSNTLLKTLQCSGTSVFIANGMAAGQKAPHVLIHVFPRKMNDGLLKLPSYNMSEDQKRKLKTILENYFIKEFGLSKHNALHNIEKKVTNETDNSDDEKKEHFKKEKNNEYTERKEIEEDEKNKKIEEKPIESSNKIKNSVKKNKLQQKNPVTAKKLEKMTKNKSNKKIDLDDIAKLFS
ncbi:TPA: hypothetical protein ENS27_01920 [bacterium]|nr:hypothetical protein [bacterium]